MEKIESYFNQLDRTIGFVRDCDHKTSIVLAAVGIVVTLVIDQCGKDFVYLMSYVNNGILEPTSSFYLFMITLGISTLFLIYGIWKLIRVLIPVTDSSLCNGRSDLERHSVLFPVSISGFTYNKYKSKITEYTDEEYVNDILSQIYINSKICARKYHNYRRGLMFSVVGIVLMIIAGIICESILFAPPYYLS